MCLSANCGWYHLICSVDIRTRHSIKSGTREVFDGETQQFLSAMLTWQWWLRPGLILMHGVSSLQRVWMLWGSRLPLGVLGRFWIAKGDFSKSLKCFCENKIWFMLMKLVWDWLLPLLIFLVFNVQAQGPERVTGLGFFSVQCSLLLLQGQEGWCWDAEPSRRSDAQTWPQRFSSASAHLDCWGALMMQIPRTYPDLLKQKFSEARNLHFNTFPSVYLMQVVLQQHFEIHSLPLLTPSPPCIFYTWVVTQNHMTLARADWRQPMSALDSFDS